MPLVSVVVIFLDAERFIEEAVQSVLDQELTDWELILVDDGSTDRSTMIARDLALKDRRIRYVDHPGHENRGMSASRNLGAAQATAPYLAFLDADDMWVPSKLAEQVDLLERMPDVAMVCGAVLYWFSWDSTSTKPDRIVRPGGIGDRRLDPPAAALTLGPLRRHTGGAAEVVVRRSVFEAVGGYEERFRGSYEDQAFYIKVFVRFPVYVSSRTWLLYRKHDESYCGHLTRADAWRLQGDFLDWLQADAEWLEDSRVRAAVRRRRREIPYLIFAAPIFELVDRRHHLKDLVKRGPRQRQAISSRPIVEPS